MKKKVLTFLKDIIYIRYYEETQLANKMLVVGFLRGIFGFRYFFYINIL